MQNGCLYFFKTSCPIPPSFLLLFLWQPNVYTCWENIIIWSSTLNCWVRRCMFTFSKWFMYALNSKCGQRDHQIAEKRLAYKTEIQAKLQTTYHMTDKCHGRKESWKFFRDYDFFFTAKIVMVLDTTLFAQPLRLCSPCSDIFHFLSLTDCLSRNYCFLHTGNDNCFYSQETLCIYSYIHIKKWIASIIF